MCPEVSKRLINVNEYYKMAEAGILKPSDRVELIHGEIIEMGPIGSKQASIVDKLNELLFEKLKGKVIIRIQSPIHLNENSEPEPDISILTKRTDRYASGHPKAKDVLTVMEVSDTTYFQDRELKGPLYASFNIPVYWIISIDKNQIEVFSSPEQSQYKKHEIFTGDDKIPLLETTLNVGDVLV